MFWVTVGSSCVLLFLLYLFFGKQTECSVPYACRRFCCGEQELRVYSKSHAAYYSFLYGKDMERGAEEHDVPEQEDPATFTSPGLSSSPNQATSSARDPLSDLAGPSTSTASTSKEPTTSTYFVSIEKPKSSSTRRVRTDTLSTPEPRSSQDSKSKDTSKKKTQTTTIVRVESDDTSTTPGPCRPPRVLPTVQSKGKYGPNTVPKGGKRNLVHQPHANQISDTEQPDPDQDVSTSISYNLDYDISYAANLRLQLNRAESAAQTTEGDSHIFSGSSDGRYAKKSQLSSLDSVKSLPYDGADLPLSYSKIGRHPTQCSSRVTGVIHPRIRSDILNSVPVCSQEVKKKPRKKGGPSVHWSNHVEYSHKQPVINDDRGTPPSPAPSTPQHIREHSVPQVHRGRSQNQERERPRQWSYEQYLKYVEIRQIRAAYAPRLVALEQAAGSRANNKYKLYDRSPPPVCKQSYYGAATASRPFHSYINPKDIVPEVKFSSSESFIRNVYEQYYNNYPSQSTAMMNPLEDHERKIIIEFCHLLEKSKQLFNGLRELPQYGHKQWSLYFGRTFDIYTRLWKYQQQHRSVLDSKYGMKRWQIGEIASKIGQLYYHFYLRTSETAYLNEAFSFYYAIRGRCYYTKANKEDKCELMVKKLRYYARFIVVCLLLNKMKLVKELIKELERQIIEYGNTYDPDDQVEWTVVVDEVKAFIHAEPVVSVVNTDNQTMILSHRLSPLITPPVERSPQMNLSLQEIVIVGSSSQQVKFSELTMDMFRMLQTLEREPSGDVQHIFDESPRQRFMSMPGSHHPEGVDSGQKLPNPHKYLLFKPSPTQMLVYLASASNDLPPNGALLLYISADGYVSTNGKHADDGSWGYDLGGLITTSKNDIYRECTKDPKASTSSKYKELQCFYPGDLYPYTRRPLFLIVDSDNSYAFQNIPRHFGQPLVILMSPLDLPPSYHDPRRQGSLFTLFLHSPLEGLCYCCDLSSVSLPIWDRAAMLLDTFMAEASSILTRSRVDPTYIAFMGDDFFRLLLARFVFCEAVLRLHRLFRGRAHRTRCSPTLPDDLFEHPTLVHIILDIASVLQIRNHIQDPSVSNNAPSGPMVPIN